jgi:glycosyltransferase involved in cell wall biosynthesis
MDEGDAHAVRPAGSIMPADVLRAGADMSRLLIDLRMVAGRMHGIGRYALELARLLPTLAPDLTFEGLGPPQGLADLGPLTPRFPVHRCPARFLSPVEQPALAWTLGHLRPDLFHATSFSVPGLWRGRLVATLHDATHLVRAHEFGMATGLYYRWVVRPTLARARALLTVSRFARDELSNRLGISGERWQVIPNGVDDRFRPIGETERQELIDRLSLPSRFLLAVGNPKLHKNLGLLARISARLPLPLVLLAGEGVFRAFPAPTRVLEAVDESLLPALYGAAEALLIPSRHEGFGLPALEAMASGTPVLAARAGALPETVGEAGELLDPDSPEAWIEAVERLLHQPGLRDRYRAAGLKRAAAFDWDHCARLTLAVYRAALA